MREFGQEEKFIGWCPVCGLPLLGDGKCRRYHIKKAAKRDTELHGKSKSPQRYYNYEQSEKGINL
uniref:Uncharacterized protein n=1 Tax=viral metagenome TaxID=1070528 RepID=A0A6M3JHV0_9ZZZZ